MSCETCVVEIEIHPFHFPEDACDDDKPYIVMPWSDAGRLAVDAFKR
jgi:hypothetical protein